MNNISERFHQLNADIEELRILVDESESKLKMFNEVFEMMGDINPEKLIILGKKNTGMYLDFIRNQITIIRKISPNIANELERRAIDFERIAPRFMELPNEKKAYIKLQKEAIANMDKLLKLTDEEVKRLNKGILDKDKQKELKKLQQESNDEKNVLERKSKAIDVDHKKIESELFMSILSLHDNVMMTSKTIIDTLDFLEGEKA